MISQWEIKQGKLMQAENLVDQDMTGSRFLIGWKGVASFVSQSQSKVKNRQRNVR